MPASEPTLRRLDDPSAGDIDQLAALLVAVVEGGASVSFMSPMTHARAAAFWHAIAKDVARGARVLHVAEQGGAIVGTVQLILEQPENQPHRADVAKMLVRPGARRQGIGEALMRAAEQSARDRGKSVLVLDTASDGAERLYARCGWTRVGVVPDYALLPQGGLCDTVFFCRRLG